IRSLIPHLVYVVSCKLEFELIRDGSHLLYHLFHGLQVGSFFGTRGHHLEEAVLQDKPAVVECTVFLQKVAEVDRLVKIANLRNEKDDVFFRDRKSTRLNSSHVKISYAVFCL